MSSEKALCWPPDESGQLLAPDVQARVDVLQHTFTGDDAITASAADAVSVKAGTGIFCMAFGDGSQCSLPATTVPGTEHSAAGPALASRGPAAMVPEDAPTPSSGGMAPASDANAASLPMGPAEEATLAERLPAPSLADTESGPAAEGLVALGPGSSVAAGSHDANGEAARAVAGAVTAPEPAPAPGGADSPGEPPSRNGRGQAAAASLEIGGAGTDSACAGVPERGPSGGCPVPQQDGSVQAESSEQAANQREALPGPTPHAPGAGSEDAAPAGSQSPSAAPCPEQDAEGGRTQPKAGNGSAAAVRMAPPRCQIWGCAADLSQQSRYNKRYRICDEHRKTLAVEVSGRRVRFCQQCARLQPVDLFKEDRRSCQASLDLHNKRQSEGALAAVAAGQMAAPACQVPGCTENLLEHKVYNQRYKICPNHRMQSEVEINGQLVRFCQQCAKTHSVEDFEGNKRSCREKLDRINNRRMDLKRKLEDKDKDPGTALDVKMVCQVPGCDPEPKDMKVYNIRNKVCNRHLSMADVDMHGRRMRFCRQCARFQDLEEFDELKRSCRARLEKHNERRRLAAQKARRPTGSGARPESESSGPQSPAMPLDTAGNASGGDRPEPSPAASAGSESACCTHRANSSGDGTSRGSVRRRQKLGPNAAAECQVPNCGKGLKDAKAYNIRYRVCPEHLTAPEVELHGQKMRFCQQCARFQQVGEFDALKRSCRQRLQKHNERGRVAYHKARANAKRSHAGNSGEQQSCHVHQMHCAQSQAETAPALPSGFIEPLGSNLQIQGLVPDVPKGEHSLGFELQQEPQLMQPEHVLLPAASAPLHPQEGLLACRDPQENQLLCPHTGLDSVPMGNF
uniref:Squamosa promoter binding 4 n=1 Tax=Tetraselmis sp. GSL018 TaxID=582737 RepID=A0A061R8W2_9CHLO|mmetsp:Transcript_20170/g.48029  ORF Transcript_20170/g.48029 Transcript_20170/m.48029 type:complete len:855 (+) Transcript_20170:523-3087(+)